MTTLKKKDEGDLVVPTRYLSLGISPKAIILLAYFDKLSKRQKTEWLCIPIEQVLEDTGLIYQLQFGAIKELQIKGLVEVKKMGKPPCRYAKLIKE